MTNSDISYVEPGGSMPFSQGLSNNLSQINPVPRIDTYFFKIYSDIFLPSRLRDGVVGHQIWKLAANILNKQSWTADKEWLSSEFGVRLTI